MAVAQVRIGTARYRTTIRTGGDLKHELTADEPERLNGGDLGPAPFDLLISALGACTAITLKMYAEKKGWPLEELDIRLEYLGSESPPRIKRVLTPVGPLDDAQRTRLADVAERTPVTLAIKNGVPIHTSLG
ncbi:MULTISPECIES: OsmC family protein [Brevundimonas]|uniref:OsmC family protein n=1 Tax=Brevundimonas TaxID=41275 RepID=UPI001903CAC4|nr:MULTISPECIES: OsmC family protein [Brevundimonas]MBK1968794.1 OsmC family protein [Brevundimonas diminuta]MDA0742941.1 OsmC family protein [Pseudomonadota bacterium]MDA1321825.1 OsmC family protein [Pseudomonadota bacterium]MDM8353075.1 OsmC family protein [Brevundimonas diminuta]